MKKIFIIIAFFVHFLSNAQLSNPSTGGSAPTTPRSYLRAGFSTTGNAITGGNAPFIYNAIIDQDNATGVITYNTTNGQATLQAGRYQLISNLKYVTSSNWIFSQFRMVSGSITSNGATITTNNSYFGQQVEFISNAQLGAENGDGTHIEEIVVNAPTIIQYDLTNSAQLPVTINRTGSGGNSAVIGCELHIYRNSLNTSVGTVVGADQGEIKPFARTASFGDWIICQGQAISTLTAAQQSVAISKGFPTNLPDMRNRSIVGSGLTFPYLTTGGTNNIAQNNLPDVAPTGSSNSVSAGTPSGTIANTVNAQFHSATGDGFLGGAIQLSNRLRFNQLNPSELTVSSAFTGSALGGHAHTITVGSINGGVTQQLFMTPYLAMNYFIWLGASVTTATTQFPLSVTTAGFGASTFDAPSGVLNIPNPTELFAAGGTVTQSAVNTSTVVLTLNLPAGTYDVWGQLESGVGGNAVQQHLHSLNTAGTGAAQSNVTVGNWISNITGTFAASFTKRVVLTAATNMQMVMTTGSSLPNGALSSTAYNPSTGAGTYIKARRIL